MGRQYVVPFEGVSVTAVQDLISILATSGMAFEVHEVEIGQITNPTVSTLKVAARRLPATVTVGSGGSSVTPGRTRKGDPAATVTARINDTTPATTGGTATVKPGTWNLVNGYLWLPAKDDRWVIAPSEGFTFTLDSAPAGAIVMSGHAIISELW